MRPTTYRDLTCADARLGDVGDSATLAGWVNRRRDLGQLIFLDLRDRYGITQVVIDNADAPEAHAIAESVRSEFVVRVSGTITRRLEGMENDKLATGDVELRATQIEILASARVLGTLHSPTLAIANGAFHEGEIRMRERTDLTEFDEKRSTPRAMQMSRSISAKRPGVRSSARFTRSERMSVPRHWWIRATSAR